MFKSLLKPKHLKWGAAMLSLAALTALVWFTVHAPQPGKDPQAQMMEKESAAFFAVERDISALARDVRTGAAGSIGLASGYALVSLTDGGRYYVRMDAQRALLPEILKDKAVLAGTRRCSRWATCSRPRAPLTVLCAQLRIPSGSRCSGRS